MTDRPKLSNIKGGCEKFLAGGQNRRPRDPVWTCPIAVNLPIQVIRLDACGHYVRRKISSGAIEHIPVVGIKIQAPPTTFSVRA